MRGLFLCGLVLALGAPGAAAAPDILELLPAAQARPLLDRDPGVQAAHAALEAARREAQILELSPHDWTARASTQRRSVRPGDRYQEWNVGIERALRLPAKADADRLAGSARIELAEARYGEALHEAAKALLTGYLDWVGARLGAELTAENGRAARENLAAVEKRVRAGDASGLDSSLARSDAAEQDRLANDARTLDNATWARLAARYAGLARQPRSLPSPPSIGPDTAYWRERIVAQSDTLRAARAALRKSRAETERLRAERSPDPTVGGFTASEIGGAERLIGFYVSIPLPGERRRLNAERGEYLTEMALQEVERAKRELEADIAAAVATASGAYESWRIAESAVQAARDNARLTQRAYALGETDLQSLLFARRQANAASLGALTATIAALKAYGSLMIDAHLIWGLEHEGEQHPARALEGDGG